MTRATAVALMVHPSTLGQIGVLAPRSTIRWIPHPAKSAQSTIDICWTLINQMHALADMDLHVDIATLGILSAAPESDCQHQQQTSNEVYGSKLADILEFGALLGEVSEVEIRVTEQLFTCQWVTNSTLQELAK